MKKLFLLFSLLLIFAGCSNEVITNAPNEKQTGSLILKIDPKNAPSNVEIITAILSRSGFDDKILEMNLLNDSTASTVFNEVPVGEWHLKVNAKDGYGNILFTGETDVDVQENIQVQVNLTLNPVTHGTGSISIFVTWGSEANHSGWLDYVNNPVILRDNSFYDINGISHPTILYDTIYKMWFNCMAENGKSYTFYATSPDGNVWTKRSSPVLSPGNSWDINGTVTHSVIKVGNTYKLYYTAAGSYKYQIGLATSTDGINWEKYPTPVLTYGYYDWENNVSSAEVVFNNNTYYMYYHGMSISGTSYAIGLATSSDGINFNRYQGNPIIVKTASWEQKGPNCPSVIYDQGQFKMVYENSEGNGISFGMAYSTDGYNWIKDSGNPLFGCPYTSKGWASAYVSYPCFRKIGNEYRIYYSGSDQFNQKTAKIGYTRKPL